jgi:hypothetical protein
MSDVLKGNFKTKRTVQGESAKQTTLEDRFEKEALKRLGGSIAFVSKKNVMWDEADKGSKAPKDGKTGKPGKG